MGRSLVFDVSDGGRELERLRELWAASLLLDLPLPRMRGLEVMRLLRGADAGDPEGIVLMSVGCRASERTQLPGYAIWHQIAGLRDSRAASRPTGGKLLKSPELRRSRELYSILARPLLGLPFHDLGESQSRHR
jgi:CheY-like chemotaxis protein